jgi:polyisoprenoid-binding protein YceI
MTTNTLLQRLNSSAKPVLLHVLPEEVFQAQRIPGSVNACVYEMAFLSRVAELFPDKTAEIIVYGAGEGSQDAATAAVKLGAAGYRSVAIYEPGIGGWIVDGQPIEGHGELPVVPLLTGDFCVSTADSLIRWTGRNLFNHHHGTVKLKGGEISLLDNSLVAARFEIDMQSIACEDLLDAGMNAMLLRHLQDADFFETASFPVATFLATSVERLPSSTEGTPNYVLHGEFTLRGITKPLSFPAVIATADGERITGQAQIELDRTEFGSHYGSGKFYRFLGRHVVNDHVQLHLKMHADRVAGETWSVC